MNNKVIHMVAFILLVIGGLNWLLVGLFDIDIVVKILGEGTIVTKAVYILVGLSALYEIVAHKSHCTTCSA